MKRRYTDFLLISMSTCAHALSIFIVLNYSRQFFNCARLAPPPVLQSSYARKMIVDKAWFIDAGERRTSRKFILSPRIYSWVYGLYLEPISNDGQLINYSRLMNHDIKMPRTSAVLFCQSAISSPISYSLCKKVSSPYGELLSQSLEN